MPTDAYEELIKAYKKDVRYACQFGMKCYQKSPAHHSKYKHPPKLDQIEPKKVEPVVTGKKRSNSECEDEATDSSKLPPTKVKKDGETSTESATLQTSSSPTAKIPEVSDSEADNDGRETTAKKNSSPTEDSETSADDGNTSASSPETATNDETKEAKKLDVETEKSVDDETTSDDPKKIISELFLVKMPDDFYKFYEFCTRVSSKDPLNALKIADIKLVGPYDVLGGNVEKNQPDDREKFLRHWRYYYDTPEFQTILKGNDKDGLHYGYWRDDPKDLPIFVAKNSANKDCKITAVAPNIFAAVSSHLDDKQKAAGPFESLPIDRLSKQLKAFAAEKGISMALDNPDMREREKKVVAKTFHTAGIVVPYDKKTQLGYRNLSATDSQFRKILKKIDEAESDDERKQAFSDIEEMVRLATIAADECDFGTCLELGHDIFSSGVERVQKTGLKMLGLAYNLLKREEFSKIAQSHAKDRKKGCDLSVL